MTAIFGAGIQGQIYGYGLNPGSFVYILIKCVPCVNIHDLAPAIALLSHYPLPTIAGEFPTLQIGSLVGALVVVAIFARLDLKDIKPSFEIEECDCG